MSQTKKTSISPSRFRWGLGNYLMLCTLILGVSLYTLIRLFRVDDLPPTEVECTATTGSTFVLPLPEEPASLETPTLKIKPPKQSISLELFGKEREEEGIFDCGCLSSYDYEQELMIEDRGAPRPSQHLPMAADRVEAPQAINLVEIKRAIVYAFAARDEEVSGLVLIRVKGDKRGKYSQHKILGNPDPLLVDAVEAKIHELRFTPAIQAGKPVEFWVNIPFRFQAVR